MSHRRILDQPGMIHKRIVLHGFGAGLAAGLFLLLAGLAFAAPAEAARKTAPPKTLDAWQARVENAEARLGEQWSACVEDLATGRIVYAYAPEKNLIPASNRKLIVMALALDKLGPDFRYRTEFGLANAPEPGSAHYHGDLILRASGDPSLSPVFMKDLDKPLELFKGWVQKIQDEGIAYVHGNLIVDASAFGEDQGKYPEAWDTTHRNFSYAPVPSALAVCDNLVRITVRAAPRSGRSGVVDVFPSEYGLRLVNKTTTGRGRNSGISAKFNADATELEVTGSVYGEKNEETILLPHPRPLEYLAGQIRRMIDKSGVRLEGEVIVQTRRETGNGPLPIARTLGVHESPPLSSLMLTMIRRSDNFLAEQIWRSIAGRVKGAGDLLTIRRIEQEWYRGKRLAWIEPGWDGSGLSRLNHVSSRDLVEIARQLLQSAQRDYLLYTLPVAGRSGTLRDRYFGGFDGRVAAKTGTLSGVSALTGFIYTKKKEPRYAFSIIGNASGETHGRLTTRIDQLVEILIRNLDRGVEPALVAKAGAAQKTGEPVQEEETAERIDIGRDDQTEMNVPASRPKPTTRISALSDLELAE